jgi:squalene synthase HpnC
MICMADSLSEDDVPVQINRWRGSSSNGSPTDSSRLLAAQAHCRRIALGHYENFLVASALLPRSMKQPFYNVYAFCRHADDLADESPSPAIATERLSQWQQELDRCFAGQSVEHPIFVALAETISRFDLQKRPFDDLLDAFRQDQIKTRFANFAELMDYCRRSANPVGHIVLGMATADSPDNIALSDSICTGLQLANHWQDIRRDFQSGRIYLPQDAMAAENISESMLADDRACEAVKRVIAAQCGQARQFLIAGLPLADNVPRWLAADIRLFAHGGLATLDAIARCDHDTLRKRPTVSKTQQFKLVLRAMLGRL